MMGDMLEKSFAKVPFFDKRQPLFASGVVEEQAALVACTECGSPTPSGVCAFCRLQARATGRRIPVTAVESSDA